MVRAHRYPRDLRAVFSRPRPAARNGAHEDARGRGRNERVVYEIDGACGQGTRSRAGVSRGRLRLPESQTQNLLRAETEALRRDVSGVLRRRSAAALCRASRVKSKQVSAPAATAADELGVPVDK